MHADDLHDLEGTHSKKIQSKDLLNVQAACRPLQTLSPSSKGRML
jgi:hypothetical protein